MSLTIAEHAWKLVDAKQSAKLGYFLAMNKVELYKQASFLEIVNLSQHCSINYFVTIVEPALYGHLSASRICVLLQLIIDDNVKFWKVLWELNHQRLIKGFACWRDEHELIDFSMLIIQTLNVTNRLIALTPCDISIWCIPKSPLHRLDCFHFTLWTRLSEASIASILKYFESAFVRRPADRRQFVINHIAMQIIAAVYGLGDMPYMCLFLSNEIVYRIYAPLLTFDQLFGPALAHLQKTKSWFADCDKTDESNLLRIWYRGYSS